MTIQNEDSIFFVEWRAKRLQNQPFLIGDRVSSEPFTVPALGFTRWRVELYPKGRESSLQPNVLSLYLRRLPSESAHYEYSYKAEVFISIKFTVYVKIRKTDEEIEQEIEDRRNRGENMRTARKRAYGKTEYERELCDKKFRIFDVNGTDIHIGVLSNGPYSFKINCEFFIGISKISNGVSDYLSLSNDLKQLFDSQDLHDLELSCGDGLLKAHRSIIACRAPELAQLWRLDTMSRDEITRINVSDISLDVLQTILEFIYTGATDIRPSQVTQELLDAAAQYGLKYLLSKAKTHPKKISMLSSFGHEIIETIFWPLSEGNGINERVHIRTIQLEMLYCDCLVITCYTPPDFLREERSQIKIVFSFEDFNKDLPIELLVCVNQFYSRYLLSEIGECTQIIHIAEHMRKQFAVVNVSAYVADGETDYLPKTSLETYEDPCTCDFFKYIADFSRLFDEQLYIDFKIICNGEEFNVHKCVLAARSPYFHAMCVHETQESQKGVVYIEDISPEIMRILLNYMYKDSFPSMEYEDVKELYMAADKCDMEKLKNKCRENLKENMNAEVILDIRYLAEMYSDDELLNFCDLISQINFF